MIKKIYACNRMNFSSQKHEKHKSTKAQKLQKRNQTKAQKAQKRK